MENTQTSHQTPLPDLPINFTMLAHDIKSPVNQINGLLELAMMQTQDEELQKILCMAVKANQNLSERVNMLLANNPYKENLADLQEVNFNETITSCLDAIKSTKGFDETSFISNINANQVKVTSKTLLQSILQNLFENAVKYRRVDIDRNIVICSIHKNKDELIIKVSDNGRGIDKNNTLSIFNKSFRIDENNVDGHGMGLYLVKNAVHNLDGQISVESYLDVGTTFTISLPNY